MHLSIARRNMWPPREWCIMVGSWLEKCWPRGVSKSNFCQSKHVRYVRHSPSMSLDKFMASRTSGHFALHMWTVKKCLISPRSRHAQPACMQPLWPRHQAAIVYIPNQSHIHRCRVHVHGTCILVHTHPVHQFRGLTLVIQNFSCLDMTRLKKTLHKRFSHNVSYNVATSLAPASGFLRDMDPIKVSLEKDELKYKSHLVPICFTNDFLV